MSGAPSATPTAPTKPAAPRPRGIRQTMSDLHIWTGLLVGWVLYAMFLTGTVSYFRDELSAYLRPELQPPAAEVTAAEVAERVAAAVLAKTPTSPQVNISLPGTRNPYAGAAWREPGSTGRRLERATFDPVDATQVTPRATRGGDFFYGFHFNLHYVPVLWGRWIAGFCAMFMLVAIVSGVITHKKIFSDFFTFRWRKGQRSWLDAHVGLSVLGLPFHFMITWSGLVTLMMLYMPWGLQTMSPAERAEVTAETRAAGAAAKPAGQAAVLRPLGEFVRQGEQRWGDGGVGSVQITHPGDANARVQINHRIDRRVSTTPDYLFFDGVSGRLLEQKTTTGAAALTRGGLYGLHMGRFADLPTRWMYFAVSLAGTAMIATGMVLWTVKRRVKLPDPERPHFGFRLVERLNIAAIAGLSIAMAAFMAANRLLPLDLEARPDWEIHVFFIAWAGTLAWAVLRPARRAWIELLAVGAVMLAGLPLLNAVLTDRGLLPSLQHGDWVFAGIDLSLLALAVVHGMLAWRVRRHVVQVRPKRAKAPRPAAQGVVGGSA